jgi:hypothetical protein
MSGCHKPHEEMQVPRAPEDYGQQVERDARNAASAAGSLRERVASYERGPVGAAQARHEARAVEVSTVLPLGKQERKATPLASGLLDYFPSALAAVAQLSAIGNEQHQPGEPLHWARHKSTDQADCLLRHLLERGTVDNDGVRHSVKVAWRALALLQLELEAAGAPMARGAR